MENWRRTARVVATGVWLYDRTVPHRVDVILKPAHFASSRYDDDDQLDEIQPIPETIDGYLYYLVTGGLGRDFFSLADAKAWADAQPWGPVEWSPTPP
jgi:hypothetical protein